MLLLLCITHLLVEVLMPMRHYPPLLAQLLKVDSLQVLATQQPPHKACLVANGSTLLERVDVDETFSPVVKPGTILTVLSLAASRHWPIHQLNVKNAFLHGDLSETVYMHQPPGFQDSVHPDYVCLLQRQGTDTAYLLLYVDDIVLTASSESFRTPIDTESKLGGDGDPVSDPTLYQSLAGSLQYLTFTRPNISYAVQQLFSSSTTDLVAYSDVDWAGCPTTRRSTSMQSCRSEASILVLPLLLHRDCWFCVNLLRGLHTPLSSATVFYCDNASAFYLSCNPVQHQRTKHIEIDIHFVRDLVATGQVRVLHVPSRY
ncbi:ribonuclease H-like domain-containing protein [Tanacetum coccineum]